MPFTGRFLALQQANSLSSPRHQILPYLVRAHRAEAKYAPRDRQHCDEDISFRATCHRSFIVLDFSHPLRATLTA
jgi:hypothetical protein